MTEPNDLDRFPDGVATWRVSTFGRVGSCALLIPAAAFFAYVGAISGAPEVVIFCTVLVPLGIWRCAFAPRVEVDRRTLRVVNPINRFSIAITEVEAVHSGYSGLEILLRNGRRRWAWAVQQSNFVLFFGIGNRSDRVVAEIQKYVAEGQQE